MSYVFFNNEQQEAYVAEIEINQCCVSIQRALNDVLVLEQISELVSDTNSDISKTILANSLINAQKRLGFTSIKTFSFENRKETISLEFIVNAIVAVYEAIKKAIIKMWQTVTGFFKSLFGSSKATEKRFEKINANYKVMVETKPKKQVKNSKPEEEQIYEQIEHNKDDIYFDKYDGREHILEIIRKVEVNYSSISHRIIAAYEDAISFMNSMSIFIENIEKDVKDIKIMDVDTILEKLNKIMFTEPEGNLNKSVNMPGNKTFQFMFVRYDEKLNKKFYTVKPQVKDTPRPYGLDTSYYSYRYTDKDEYTMRENKKLSERCTQISKEHSKMLNKVKTDDLFKLLKDMNNKILTMQGEPEKINLIKTYINTLLDVIKVQAQAHSYIQRSLNNVATYLETSQKLAKEGKTFLLQRD